MNLEVFGATAAERTNFAREYKDWLSRVVEMGGRHVACIMNMNICIYIYILFTLLT